ncbi:MAG: type II secretion system protein N, partial [Pseudomonadota bacterium]
MLIDSVSGSVWDGEMRFSTHINNNSGTVVDLGTLQWDIDWLPLFKANLSSQQQWLLAENSQIGFDFEKELLSAQAPLLLTGLQGSIDIAELVQSLASAGLPTFAATGQIIARDAEITLNQSTFWPEKVNGQFEIHSLSTFGLNLPVVTAVSSMEAQVIHLKLSAQEDGWQLQGSVTMAPNH